MSKRKILLNSLSAVVQVLAVGVMYLILYRYVLDQIGVELLGVWSLIVATTSVASIANFGMSSSIVKFVATYQAREDLVALEKLIFTSAVFVFCTYTIMACLIHLISGYILPYFIDKAYISIAVSILPFSLVSLVINSTGGIFNSALDGIQKNYVKSAIITASVFILLLFSIYLTPIYGLHGLVYAQVIQSVFVFVVTVISFRRVSNIRLKNRWNWDSNIFREIFGYGIKIQAASVLEMTFEPVTKFMLSKFGGLTFVGFYEMATRLLVQLRGLIVSANQVIIPVVAESNEIADDEGNDFYRKLFQLIFFLATLWAGFVLVSAPLISLLWLGTYERIFVEVLVIGTIANYFNILSTPAYFSFLGEGKLNWILYSILTGFILNLTLGYSLGLNFGGLGAVLGFNISLFVQSLIIIGSFHFYKRIKSREFLRIADLIMIILSGVISFLSWRIYGAYQDGDNCREEVLLLAVFVLLCSLQILKHPSFLVLRNLLTSIVRRRN